MSEYQAERLADDYEAALDQYNQALTDQYGYGGGGVGGFDEYGGGYDPYASDMYPYPDAQYDYYGQGYNGLVDDLGYYP